MTGSLYALSVVILANSSVMKVTPLHSSGGELYCFAPVYDFQEIITGERVAHLFLLVNRGSTSAKIVDIQSSCNCTIAAEGLIGKTIPPGKWLGVPVQFDSRGVLGRVHKELSIRWSGDVGGIVKVSVSGNVVQKFVVSPNRLNYGVVSRENVSIRRVLVRSLASQHLDVKKLYSDSSWLSVHTDVHSIDTLSIHAIARAPSQLGRHEARLLVQLNDQLVVIPCVLVSE